MTLLIDYALNNCGTGGLRVLDLQLIERVQKIAPNVLNSFAHLPINCGLGCHPFLQPNAVGALTKAIVEREKRMKCNSAWRSFAQQAVLYYHYETHRCDIKRAAIPGTSNHEQGLAIDIEDAKGWKPYLEKHGWRWFGPTDPMHFDFIKPSVDITSISIRAFQELWNANNIHDRIPEDGKYGILTAQKVMKAPTDGFKSFPLASQLVN